MKSILSAFLTVVTAVTSTSVAHAQVLINWQPVVGLTDDSDVQTNGTYFAAANSTQGSGYTDTTVNGVVFNSQSTQNGVTIESDGGDFYNPGGFLGGSANYQNIINNGSDANSGNGLVIIGSTTNSLNLGGIYQVQAFGFWAGPYNAILTGNPSVTFPAYSGGYTIGTFTAMGPTESFIFGGAQGVGGHAGFLNDVSVRQVGQAPVVLDINGPSINTLEFGSSDFVPVGDITFNFTTSGPVLSGHDYLVAAGGSGANWDDSNATFDFVAPYGYTATSSFDSFAETLTVQFQAAPEPSTYVSLLIGLGALAFVGYRKKMRMA